MLSAWTGGAGKGTHYGTQAGFSFAGLLSACQWRRGRPRTLDVAVETCGGAREPVRLLWLRCQSIVLLEGAHCDDRGDPATVRCDRQCCHFWRTEWVAGLSPDEMASPGGIQGAATQRYKW
jgi:hypothetical protein